LPLNQSGKIRKKTGFRIHPAAKIVLGLFILWASPGVGELAHKAGMIFGDLDQFYEKFIK